MSHHKSARSVTSWILSRMSQNWIFVFSLHNHYMCVIIPNDFTVWWSVWDHGCDIMLWLWFQIQGSKSDRSRCSVGFGWPARAYPHHTLFRNQNARLFSISDFKTCCFIIWFPRFTIDSLKIPFSVQIDLLAAVRCQRGVNEGSTGAQGPLTWSPNKVDRFCVFTVQVSLIAWNHGCGFMDPWSTSMVSRYDAGIMDFDHGSMKIIRRVWRHTSYTNHGQIHDFMLCADLWCLSTQHNEHTHSTRRAGN